MLPTALSGGDEDFLDAKPSNGYAKANGGSEALTNGGSSYRPPKGSRILRIPAKQAVAHVNIVVAGGSGLGKTTFIRQFFNEFVTEGLVPHDGTQTPMDKFKKEGGPSSLCTHLSEPVSTVSGEYELYYHVQDTPGHANSVSSELKHMLLNYVRNEKEAHFRIRLDRQNDGSSPPPGDPLRDGRPDRLIDLCLYFISPQSFSQLDVDIITELSKEVMVIPVCAKADAMTVDERTSFQQLIRDRLTAEGITYANIEDELKHAAKAIGLPQEGLQHRPPFVVVASNTYRHIDGESRAVRQYPWGDCVITDPKHSDFSLIKEFITTAAFHKLRSFKKRMFHRYCRQRMGTDRDRSNGWDVNSTDGRGTRGSEFDEQELFEKQRSKDQQDMARLTQELQRVKADLDRERSSAASAAAARPIHQVAAPEVRTPEIKTKKSLFGK